MQKWEDQPGGTSEMVQKNMKQGKFHKTREKCVYERVDMKVDKQVSGKT